MPKPALSLLGYLQQENAIKYLQTQCLIENASPETLLQEYQNAQSLLGAAIERAGYPEILDIPTGHENYLNMVQNSPFARSYERGNRVSVQLVEIAPLLAFQTHIELDRTENPSTELANVLSTCLPMGPQQIPYEPSQPQSPNSVMIRTPSLNLRAFESSFFLVPNAGNYLGVRIDVANPFVQVVLYDGRAYLINGFHRAYSLGRAGAKHLACIFQEVHSLTDKINLAFPIEVLQSENPPTVGHLLYDRAYPVNLRNYKKYMQVTYSEHVYFEE